MIQSRDIKQNVHSGVSIGMEASIKRGCISVTRRRFEIHPLSQNFIQ